MPSGKLFIVMGEFFQDCAGLFSPLQPKSRGKTVVNTSGAAEADVTEYYSFNGWYISAIQGLTMFLRIDCR